MATRKTMLDFLPTLKKWTFSVGAVVLMLSIAIAGDLPSKRNAVTVSTDLLTNKVLRIFIKNNSDSPILVYDNRTRPPFMRFTLLNRVGENITPISWRGDIVGVDLEIASGGTEYFDIEISAWFPEIEALLGSQCLDFLWAWNVSIDGYDKPFFFGGAVPISCIYENR